MNHRSYAQPDRGLPARGTVLADIVLSLPDIGFATVNEICARVGHHQRSIPSILEMAKGRNYAKPRFVPRRTPQQYRLTQFGRLVKAQLAHNNQG